MCVVQFQHIFFASLHPDAIDAGHVEFFHGQCNQLRLILRNKITFYIIIIIIITCLRRLAKCDGVFLSCFAVTLYEIFKNNMLFWVKLEQTY